MLEQVCFFKASEVYLNHVEYVLGSSEGGTEVAVESGDHDYSFTFELPRNAPPTYRGTVGGIE